jgi:hypothetical protein
MDVEAEIERLKAEVAALKAQAQAAADYIAVSNLQRSYGYYVDKARWDDVADLFADDCSMEINGRGVYLGQDRVRAYMHKFGPARFGALMNHTQLQPIIHIAPDGLTAKARLRSFMMVGELGGAARWGDGVYENEYVKQDGVWKISKLHFYQTFYVDYEAGWNKAGLPLVPVYPDFPPDQPPSEDYKVYPDYYLPPYHYKNPVSGR